MINQYNKESLLSAHQTLTPDYYLPSIILREKIILDLDLKHYSDKPNLILEPLYNKGISTQSEHSRKPSGFWVSISESWKTFWEQESNYCQAPEMLDNLKYCYDIKLSDDINILLIDTPEKMLEFNDHYGTKYGNTLINWKSLAYDYQGIILPSYFDMYRLNSDLEWYYTWDCASGCIWDISCIMSVDNIKEPKLYYDKKLYQ